MAKRTAEQSVEKCTVQFCIFPRKSIKLLAETVGIRGLSNEASGLLAEDTSYRLRQVIQSAAEFAKHSKRDCLTGSDIKQALLWSRVEPIYGNGLKNSNIFSSIATKDGDLFYHEDKEVNLRELAFSKGLPTMNELGDCHSKISVEVSLLDKTKTTLKQGPNDGSGTSNFDSLSEPYKMYYNTVTRNILEAEENVVQKMLADIKTNPRIQVFLPFLVNFISNGIMLLIGNFEKVLRLLSLVKTLMNNKNLYLEPWVVQLVRAVMYCVVEKPTKRCGFSSCDEWTLRNRAVQVLCHIDRKCSNSANYLHHQLIRTFRDIYEDKTRPVYSQYGAIVGITMLSIDAIEQTLLPHFKTYIDNMEKLRHTDSSQAAEFDHIAHALQCGLLAVFRSKVRYLSEIATKKTDSEQPTVKSQNNSSHQESDTSHKTNYPHLTAGHSRLNRDMVTWYKNAYDVFGEAFVLQIGFLEDFKSVVHSPPATPASKTTPLRRLQGQFSNFPYIRNLIKEAVLKRADEATQSEDYSCTPAKKRRPLQPPKQELQTFSEIALYEVEQLVFLNYAESEARFDNFVSKSRSFRHTKTTYKDFVHKLRKSQPHPSSNCASVKLAPSFSLSYL